MARAFRPSTWEYTVPWASGRRRPSVCPRPNPDCTTTADCLCPDSAKTQIICFTATFQSGECSTDRKRRNREFVVGRWIAAVRAVGEEGVMRTAVGGGRLVVGLHQVQRTVVGHHEIIEHIILEEGRHLQGDVHVTGRWSQMGEILWLFLEHCNTGMQILLLALMGISKIYN